MKVRNWTVAAFLAAAFSMTALPLKAQVGDEEGQGEPQAEQNSPQYAPPPLRVDIVEDQATADARERREKEADQREVDALLLQKRMEDISREMAEWAEYQTYLVAFGTALLFFTLMLTRQANKAARDAVRVTREIGMAQARAYLSHKEWKTYPWFDADGNLKGILIEFSFQNTGTTPASLTHIHNKVVIDPNRSDDFIPVLEVDLSTGAVDVDCGAGNTYKMARQLLNIETLRKIDAQEIGAYAIGYVRYHDIFFGTTGELHEYKIAVHMALKYPLSVITTKDIKLDDVLITAAMVKSFDVNVRGTDSRGTR